MAHNSIDPSEEWQTVIEAGLRSCDGMVVFLHEGFRESAWCDQEVGYALARRVPVLPVGIDLLPYGFMGKLQAAKCSDEGAPRVAEKVLQWLLRTPSAQSAMTEGLVAAFERSSSYEITRKVIGMLEKMPTFSPNQLQRLEGAARSNDQVSAAVLRGRGTVPDLVTRLIAERGGTPASAHDPWSDEPPF